LGEFSIAVAKRVGGLHCSFKVLAGGNAYFLEHLKQLLPLLSHGLFRSKGKLVPLVSIATSFPQALGVAPE
jgi:hypothetical protein